MTDRAYFVGGPWNGEEREVELIPRIAVPLPSPGVIVAGADIPSTSPELAVGEYELDPRGQYWGNHGRTLVYEWRGAQGPPNPQACNVQWKEWFDHWAQGRHGMRGARPTKSSNAPNLMMPGMTAAAMVAVSRRAARKAVWQKFGIGVATTYPGKAVPGLTADGAGQFTISPLHPVSYYAKKAVPGLHTIPHGLLTGITEADSPVAEDPPELPIEESDKALVGYRCWLVADRKLRSPTTEKVWESPILRVEKEPCAYDPHEFQWAARNDHCHGIYAWFEPDWAEWRGHNGMVLGRIEATGTCVVHDRGFRAQVVRIEALVLCPTLMGEPGLVDAMSERYQCDVGFDPSTLEVTDEKEES